MATITLYHNPRCSKSREALQLLKDRGFEPTIVEYMKDVPSERDMELLLHRLGIPAEQLLRKGEKLFKEKYKSLRLNEHEWVKVMLEHPRLIERPIVVKGHKAVIGRPIEKVEDLISKK